MKRLLLFAFVALLTTITGTSFTQKDSSQKIFKANSERRGSYYTKYGQIPLNSIVVRNRVKNNEYLSVIFLRYGVPTQILNQINVLDNSIFNVRSVKSGNKYAFIYKIEDGKFVPTTFVYEKNKVEYYTFDFENELQVKLHKKPVEYVEKITSGIITSSLYQTIVDSGDNPDLSLELSKIYAWTIDFHRIQKNDHFKAIYMEGFVEGESIGDFKILASNFNHFGKDRTAFYFEEECKAKSGNYYDEEGNSMKRAFLKAPVEYSRISSKYSGARLHPVTKQMKAHLGTDYAAPHGTPIMSTADGVIEQATFGKHNGYFVKVKHNSVYSTQYLHMSRIASGIRPGVYVKQGDIIGYVGSTGLATGPHVCYRFWKNGKQVDPFKEDLPQYESLEGATLTIYLEYIKEIKERLNEINHLPS
jgi:murein DD-endopeptidase MepM/ murein hydrolase activator NlpD